MEVLIVCLLFVLLAFLELLRDSFSKFKIDLGLISFFDSNIFSLYDHRRLH